MEEWKERGKIPLVMVSPEKQSFKFRWSHANDDEHNDDDDASRRVITIITILSDP